MAAVSWISPEALQGVFGRSFHLGKTLPLRKIERMQELARKAIAKANSEIASGCPFTPHKISQKEEDDLFRSILVAPDCRRVLRCFALGNWKTWRDPILGQGGIKKVKPAIDLMSGERYVVVCGRRKHVTDKDLENEIKHFSFFQEMGMAPRLQAFATTPKKFYVVQEEGNCGTIPQFLEKPHTIGERWEIALGVLRLIAKLHGLGYIHRDLKPDNFVISRTEKGLKVMLIDFEFTCLKEGAALDGANWSKADYMSPERTKALVERNGDAVRASMNFKDEMFLVGAILYFIFYGEHLPCTFGTLQERHGLMNSGQEWRPETLRTNPCHQRVLVNNLIRNDPAERWSAEEAYRIALRAAGELGAGNLCLD